jgi:hypothetical protein
MARGLTLAEEKFAQAYIDSGSNAELAWAMAFGQGRRDKGWSNSSRMLRKPAVVARIMELRAGIVERLELTRDKILAELEAVAFHNVADYLTHDGKTLEVRDINELTRDQARCIQSITETEHGLKITFHDKLQAINLINKMLGHYGNSDSVTLRTFCVRVPFVSASAEAWLEDHSPSTRLPAPPQQIEASTVDAER